MKTNITSKTINVFIIILVAIILTVSAALAWA
jgi:hypothetical protein